MDKTLHYILELPIYPCDIIFSFNETEEVLFKRLKKVGFDYVPEFTKDNSLGSCSQFNNGDILLKLSIFPNSPDTYNTLQHEIFHAVHYIMTYIGVKFCNESEESYAYLVGYITEKIYEQIAKIK